MSSASVKLFRSRTQNPEQSKLTKPHCNAFSGRRSDDKDLTRTLWKLMQRESTYLFIAGTRQRSLNSGQEKAAPAQAAST